MLNQLLAKADAEFVRVTRGNVSLTREKGEIVALTAKFDAFQSTIDSLQQQLQAHKAAQAESEKKLEAYQKKSSSQRDQSTGNEQSAGSNARQPSTWRRHPPKSHQPQT